MSARGGDVARLHRVRDGLQAGSSCRLCLPDEAYLIGRLLPRRIERRHTLPGQPRQLRKMNPTGINHQPFDHPGAVRRDDPP